MSERRSFLISFGQIPLINSLVRDSHKAGDFRVIHELFLVLTGESNHFAFIVEERIKFIPTERRPQNAFQLLSWFYFASKCSLNFLPELRPKRIIIGNIPIFGYLLFGEPGTDNLLVLVFDFVGFKYSLYRIQQLLFIIISRSAIHRRFCADRESSLNIHYILFQWNGNTVHRFSLILCFDFISLTSFFIEVFLSFFFKNLSVRIFLFVNHDFMSFRIPIIPKFATVGKFSLPTFLQVVYLLPDVRQC